MTTEVSSLGAYGQYEAGMKKIAAKQKKTVRLPDFVRPEISTRYNSEEYRSGWDRIFGKKAGNDLPEPDPPAAGGASPGVRCEAPTDGDLR